ncbi:MAG: cytochrome c oxidase subunit II [Gammaproteobacteria bacterium]
MAVAIVLVLIVVASLLFNFLNPWWFTPLASNWGQMDLTLIITLWISGIVFVAITLFMAYAVFRYRHQKGRRAAYEPENRKLEWWLIGLTSVGIVIMLIPGLYVWAEFVNAPKDALSVEVVGQQWQWSFRFPGKDGVLGRTDTRLISAENSFGLHTGNPFGQDDVLVKSGDLHLPLGKPIKVLLRSKDVVHDFYVPHFRVKMDAVPGLVSGLWFTPTKTGTFEIACAEYCGVGHHTMRSRVVVEEEGPFQAWLNEQPTLAQALSEGAAETGDPLVKQGRKLAQDQGCLACHSVDGSPGAGPTWKGLYGKTETLADGSTAVVDDEYLKESITNPGATVVKGYDPLMPPYQLSREDLDALIAYTKALSEKEPRDSGKSSTR